MWTKKGLKSKITALLLCVMMLATMLPAFAMADLATPPLVSASAEGSGIRVIWQAVSGADVYRVFRKVSGGAWSRVADVTSTSYLDNKAAENTKYLYTVRCVGADGSYVSDYERPGLSASWPASGSSSSGSSSSGSSSGTLATPVLESARAEGKSIRVTWKAVSGASLYRVFRKTGGGKWTQVGDTSGTSLLDSSAAVDTVYTYTVRCVAAGGGYASDYERPGVTASWTESTSLATPVLVNAAPEGAGIHVTWKPVGGAYAYRVFKKTSGGKWARVGDTSATSYMDSNLKADTTYIYTVRCIDADGSYVSDYDKAGLKAYWGGGASGTYNTPVLKKVNYSGNALVVTWDAVSGASAYNVYRRTNGGKWARVGYTSSTSYKDETVSSGNKYTYTVRVRDAAGNNVSNFDANGITATFYGVPQMTGVTAVSNGVKVTWNAVKGAENYAVYRRPEGGSFIKLANTPSTSYTDTGLGEGVTYYYTALVISPDGKTRLGDYDRTGVSGNYVGYTQISSLTPVNGGVQISWSKTTGASSYRLFRKFGTGDWTSVAVLPATAYTDTQVVNNTTYSYYLRALDSAGKYIGDYDSAGKTITYYATPTLIDCERSASGLTTTWEAVEGVTNYAVLRKIGNGNWLQQGVTSGTSYLDSTLPSGTKAYYTVRCVALDGATSLSAYNATGVGETSFMDQPVMYEAENDDGYVYVSWDEVDKASYYNVYRRTGAASGAWMQVESATPYTYYEDHSVKNGGTYYYTASASDENGDPMSEFDTTGVGTTYFNKPALTGIENVVGGVKVTWKAVDGIGTYQIYRRTGNAGWSTYATATGTSFTDTGVTSNGHYWYTVSCLSGISEVSAWDYNGLDITYHPAPTMTGLTVNNGSISISWAAVDGISTYKVYRKVGTGKWAAVTDVNGLSYKDTAITSGTKYAYTVRCVQNGSVVSDYDTNGVKSAVYLAVPGVSVSSTKAHEVKISWGAVTGATGYTVYRRTAGTSWAEVKSVTTTSYTDTGLTSSNVYYYMVVATGSNSARSANGSGVSVTVK